MRRRLIDLRIRPATPADTQRIQAIEVQAGERFRTVGLDHIADHAPPTAEELDHAELLLVAEVAGQAVGYVWGELLGPSAHLEQLSVLPDHGHQGVGTALIDAVIDWARRHGQATVTLMTFRDVPFNAPLYARRGFAELVEADWSPELRALVAEEAHHGLDPSQRVVMARPTQ